jgi:uncharacterized membrane protein
MSKITISKRSWRLAVITAVTALVGLADTIYLTLSHYGGEVSCSIVEGCNLVLASSWATIFGVPTAIIGVGYYFLILLLLGLFLRYCWEAFLLAVVAVTIVGFIFSLGFLYLQIFVIAALCEYCLLSLATTTVILIASLGQLYTRE